MSRGESEGHGWHGVHAYGAASYIYSHSHWLTLKHTRRPTQSDKHCRGRMSCSQNTFFPFLRTNLSILGSWGSLLPSPGDYKKFMLTWGMFCHTHMATLGITNQKKYIFVYICTRVCVCVIYVIYIIALCKMCLVLIDVFPHVSSESVFHSVVFTGSVYLSTIQRLCI